MATITPSPLISEISQYHHLALDTSCFIYHFSGHPAYTPLTHTLFSSIETGQHPAITSTLTITEVFTLPEKTADPFELQAYEQFFLHFPHLELLPPTYPICRLAAKLRSQYLSLKTPDALHLGTALYHQADCFITNDKRLKCVKEIPLIILDTFIPKASR